MVPADVALVPQLVQIAPHRLRGHAEGPGELLVADVATLLHDRDDVCGGGLRLRSGS